MSEVQEQNIQMYTDEELCWASQVAYCNIDGKYVSDYYKKNGEYPTLQEIFKEAEYSIYYDQELLEYIEDDGSDTAKMAEGARTFMDDIRAGNICQGWRVVSVADTNSENGFYGLTIETGEDNAIVAFRESKSVDIRQFIKEAACLAR